MIYILYVRGSGCLTLKLSTTPRLPVGHQETFHFHRPASVFCPFFPFLVLSSVFIALFLSDRRSTITRLRSAQPVNNAPARLHFHNSRRFRPLQCTIAIVALFLKLPPAAAATSPHLGLPRIYITRNSANRTIPLNAFQAYAFPHRVFNCLTFTVTGVSSFIRQFLIGRICRFDGYSRQYFAVQVRSLFFNTSGKFFLLRVSACEMTFVPSNFNVLNYL